MSTQKSFLDLDGLGHLWGKIKGTFADKTSTEASINDINKNIGTISVKVDSNESGIGELESAILTITPVNADYYSEALEYAKSRVVGTLIYVKYSNVSAEDQTPSGFSTGIYVVVKGDDGNNTLQYINTSSGDINESDISALDSRVETLENTVITGAKIIDNISGNYTEYSVVDNVLLIEHDDEFDINSDSVKALTHRAIAAKFQDMMLSINQIPKFKISVVDELPTSEISFSTVYLLRNGDNNTTKNLYTEYIAVETTKDDPTTPDINEQVFVWEKLGEQTLIIEDFVTDNELSTALSNALKSYVKTETFEQEINEFKTSISSTYATKTEVGNISTSVNEINTKLASDYMTADEIDTTYLSKQTASNTYVTKDTIESAGYVTENDILTSIQSGTIGETIKISNEQIDGIAAL